MDRPVGLEPKSENVLIDFLLQKFPAFAERTFESFK